MCNDAPEITCGSVHTSLSAPARLETAGSEAAETTYLRPMGRGENREGLSATASVNGGRRVRLDDKPNKSKLPQAPSTSVEPKTLTGSSQKAGSRLFHLRLGTHGHTRLPVREAGAKSFVSPQQNRKNPASRLGFKAGASARNANGMTGMGDWKKPTPPCNGADRRCNITPPCKRADFQMVARDERTGRTFTGGNSK